MATNQEGVHAAIRASTGTARDYIADWHALFDDAGIASGTFNERMLAWINDRLGESYTNLPGAMHAFAVDQGFSSWSAMNTLSLGVQFTPGVASMSWTGYAPSTVSGVGWSISPGVGQATWSGLQPDVQVLVSVSPGVAAMSWTGPAPTITGLAPDGQIVMRNGDTLIDRAGDPIINVAQS